MRHSDEEFEDPVLKNAVMRAFGAEQAPEGLRQHVQARLASERRIEQRLRWQRPLYGLAAAAVLLIGFGIAYQMLWNREDPAPKWFAAAMVNAHTVCADRSDHHLLAVPGDADWTAIRTELHNQLGFTVAAAPLGDDWKFEGAGVCEVSGTKAAHLLFKRGDETVSVFSIPVALLTYSKPAPDGTSYSQIEQGLPVSGFIQGGAVHCLVGSGKSKAPSLRSIQELRDRLRPAVSKTQASLAGACSPSL